MMLRIVKFVVGDILRAHRGGAGVVSDAHLVALAIEHDLTLCAHDGGLRSYEKPWGLRLQLPFRGDR